MGWERNEIENWENEFEKGDLHAWIEIVSFKIGGDDSDREGDKNEDEDEDEDEVIFTPREKSYRLK